MTIVMFPPSPVGLVPHKGKGRNFNQVENARVPPLYASLTLVPKE